MVMVARKTGPSPGSDFIPKSTAWIQVFAVGMVPFIGIFPQSGYPTATISAIPVGFRVRLRL